ncbi:MAG: GvpL/GvpF family gas vesicle protein, partial [Solirubrobacteraceae bacterium]
DAADPGAPGTGAAYMLRRRRDRELRERAEELAAALADAVHDRLRELACEAVVNAPQNPELSGHEGDMVLNAAYLVAAGDVPRLRAAVEELRDGHRALRARIELSGPFPPYTFAGGEA